MCRADHSSFRSKRMVEEEAVDHPIPDVPVSITILVVSVAVVFTVWVPVIMYRAATYTDALLARHIAEPEFQAARILDKAAFDYHLNHPNPLAH